MSQRFVYVVVISNVNSAELRRDTCSVVSVADHTQCASASTSYWRLFCRDHTATDIEPLVKRHNKWLTRFFLGSQIRIKVTFHICWQNSQYKRSCLQTPPSHCRVDVRKCFFTDRVQKPWDSLPVELHHFSSLSVSSVLFLVLICLSLLHVRFYPPLGRGICFTVWFFFVFFFVRFLVNDFSTTRGPIHAKFCMRAYSSSGCLIPFWGLAAPGGGKRGKCPMRMVGLCHFYWRTC